MDLPPALGSVGMCSTVQEGDPGPGLFLTLENFLTLCVPQLLPTGVISCTESSNTNAYEVFLGPQGLGPCWGLLKALLGLPWAPGKVAWQAEAWWWLSDQVLKGIASCWSLKLQWNYPYEFI